ncbi:MAG TPA: phosphotransferase family protein, partial [Stellaceae bacterium]|nr:phosphotransferase family protein [Stellaceae bacterium]
MTVPRKYLGATVEVKSAHAIEIGPLEAHLREHVAGFRGKLRLRQFEGGQSNPTYLVETPERRYVLRRKPPGVLLPSAHAVDREFRVMAALFATGFPVPEPLHYCGDSGPAGSPFYVMAHVEGRIFLDCRMPDLKPHERAAIYDDVNATLARLHRLDPAAIGLGDFGRPGNYFARQVERWSKQYLASQTRPIPAMDRLIAWLPQAVPPLGETRLIHGDFSFHNLLIHPTEPQVVGVIDWELSTTGDPLGDLTYHGMEWYRPAGVDERGTLAGADLVALGIPDFDAYAARYFERVGRPKPDDLRFHRAFNLFRVAAILQGVAARARAGNAAAADAGTMEARVPVLAEAAWRE